MVNQNALNSLQNQPHIISFLAEAVNEKIVFLQSKSSSNQISVYQEKMFLKFDSLARSKKLFIGNDTELKDLQELKVRLKAM